MENKKLYRVVSEPSEKDLMPTERRKREISELMDWEGDSKKYDWSVGTTEKPRLSPYFLKSKGLDL